VSTNKTVLVVDDDPLVLESMLLLFAATGGFETIAARGAGDADAVLRSSRAIDVLVADIVLAGTVSGLEVCRNAVALRPDIAIVVITADPEAKRDEVVERGVFLRKPFGADTLLTAIRQAMDQVPVAGSANS
jgi:CheY-like chemotaxis protein